jgi:hemerythrin-like domain-containing protein
MAEALPSTGGPGPSEQYGCDTSDMFLVHKLLRSLFGDAPMLVTSVPVGDRERAAVIADHLAEIADGLHDHHHTEDDELWDRLETREPACTLHVSRMKAAHAEIAVQIEKLTSALPAWRASASAADRASVLAIMETILRELGDHLGDEEVTILPIASRTMTQAEWDRMGEIARAKVPRSRLFLQLGFILDTVPEQDRERWKKDFLPAPARILYALVGKRQYEKHRRLVYGDAA